MKKTLSLILALILCLSLCACGGATQPTEPAVTLEPLTEFPAYSEDFQVLVDHITVDQKALETFFGYTYAAYNAYDAETFCAYIYQDLDFSVFEDIQNELSKGDPSDAILNLAMVSGKTELIRIRAQFASCNVSYTGLKADQIDTTYESVREQMVSAVNEYAQFIYGCDILTPAA